MIADDQPLVGELLSKWVVKQAGYKVELVTTDALALLNAAEKLPSAVAIVDATMPHSFRVLRALTCRAVGHRVLLLDDHRHAGHLRLAIDGGAAGYATKHDPATALLSSLLRIGRGLPAFPTDVTHRTNEARRSAYSAETTEADPSPALLTSRELQVLQLLAEGLRVRDCGTALSISPNTVENHKARIMRKLGMHKTVDLTRFAIRHGISSDR